MSANTLKHQSRLEMLQSEYERAWRSFTFEVESFRSVQSAVTQGDGAMEARDRAEQARLEYRDARNALADYLLEQQDAVSAVPDEVDAAALALRS